MTITNVNQGLDHSRIQENKPSFFVNWMEDGKQNYKYFSIRSSAEKLYQRLIEQEIRDEFERMNNQPLVQLEIFSKEKYQALSQYGYCLEKGFDSALDAEKYTIEYYKTRMNFIRQ
jgi:hypothetical protein